MYICFNRMSFMKTQYLIISSIISLCSVFSYFSYHSKKLQPTVCVFVSSIFFVLLLNTLLPYFQLDQVSIRQLFSTIDFQDIVIDGILSYLLFAGSLHVCIKRFRSNISIILILAFFGTTVAVISTASLVYFLQQYFGGLPLVACLLFAAAVSPTDPVAVLAMLKKLDVSLDTKVCIAGESLLNDGVGIVFFTTFLGLTRYQSFNLVHMLHFFLHEVVGGLFLGFLIAQLSCFFLYRDQPYLLSKKDIVWSIGIVNITQVLSALLGVNPALATVSLGLTVAYLIENISAKRQSGLLTFWDIIDELLNFVLFFMAGLEFFHIVDVFYPVYVQYATLAIGIATLSRFLSVYMSMGIERYWYNRPIEDINIIALGGIKGGLSLALVKLIPNTLLGYQTVFIMTYSVVCFTMIVQGLYIVRYIRLGELQKQVS